MFFLLVVLQEVKLDGQKMNDHQDLKRLQKQLMKNDSQHIILWRVQLLL